MEGVRDCAVFGIPDAEYGERLCACVEPEANVTLSAEAVRTYLRSRLANFKVPKEVHFHDALPREATGKIFKRKLRDPFWSGHVRAEA
ncbi:long-chain fatty acid--CoA ligase, partial [Escherichia coli]|nr:long-chain fatty acid--CoA ligase [Escherichia coli]